MEEALKKVLLIFYHNQLKLEKFLKEKLQHLQIFTKMKA